MPFKAAESIVNTYPVTVGKTIVSFDFNGVTYAGLLLSYTHGSGRTKETTGDMLNLQFSDGTTFVMPRSQCKPAPNTSLSATKPTN